MLGAPAWARDTAAHGLGFLNDRFRDSRHGGFFLTTDLAGQPRDRRKDSYAHAFVLFAMAYYYRATRDAEALAIAARTLDLLEQHLADPVHGGFLEGASESWEPLSEVRRQNPHMHLLEAFLALYAASEERRYLEHAQALIRLLEERLVDAEQGCLGEYFTDDWKPYPDARGQVLEPGHHFEWVWLLHEYAARTGNRSPLAHADRIFRFGLEFGTDPDDGGAFDEINRQREVVRDTKRLWPQTELIKALVARYEARPEAETLARLEQALDYCFTRYVDPAHRGWNDHLTRAGEVFTEYMPATSVYHITLALSEVIRVLERDPG